MNELKKSFGVLFAFIMCAPTLFAESSQTSSSQTLQYPKYSGAFSIDLNSNLEKDQTKRKMSSTMELYNSLKLDDITKVTLYLAAVKDYQDERETEMQNGFLSISRKITDFGPQDSAHTFRLEGRAYLPFNKDAYQNDSFRTRAYIAPIFTLNGGAIGAHDLELVLKSAFSRNFHQYNESKDGTVNTKTTWANSATLNYSFTDQFSASAYYLHQRSVNYRNRRLADRYELGQSLAYSFTQNTELEIGHIIGGTTYKYNGVDNNINFFNKNDSTIYSALNFSF